MTWLVYIVSSWRETNNRSSYWYVVIFCLDLYFTSFCVSMTSFRWDVAWKGRWPLKDWIAKQSLSYAFAPGQRAFSTIDSINLPQNSSTQVILVRPLFALSFLLRYLRYSNHLSIDYLCISFFFSLSRWQSKCRNPWRISSRSHHHSLHLCCFIASFVAIMISFVLQHFAWNPRWLLR